MTLQLGFDLQPSAYLEEKDNPFSDIITVRWKNKAIIYTRRWHWHQILRKMLWCQISLGKVGGFEGRIHSQFYLQHFWAFIMRGCAGLTAWGGLNACEDYWQYASTKQLWKANNCLKVNNNTVLSQQGVGGGFNTNQIELIFQPMFHLWDAHMFLLVYIYDLLTEIWGGKGI